MSNDRLPEPATLVAALEVVRRLRPKLDAGPLVWVAFHRQCAEVYAHVATVDHRHRYEAQALAGQEIRQAREIENHLASN